MKQLTPTERANFVTIAVRTTAFLREFCRKDGVPGLGDFLNGMLTAGMSLDRRIEGEGSFLEMMEDEVARASEIQSSKAFKHHEGSLKGHRVGEILAEKSSLSLIVSIACEGKFIEVANELKVNKEAMLRMVAMGVVATVCDASDEESLDEHLGVALWSVQEKARAADALGDLSDEDLFGEDFTEDFDD